MELKRKIILAVCGLLIAVGLVFVVLIFISPEKVSFLPRSIIAFAAKQGGYSLPPSVEEESISDDVVIDKAFLRQFRNVFISLGKKARPAVVMIITERLVENQKGKMSPFSDDFFFPFLPPEMRGGKKMEQYQKAAGSGFIVDLNQRYILTNNHVITGAKTISVTTVDGSQYSATIVGADEETDIAVLQADDTLNKNDKLKQVILADSSKVQVGDRAIALGAPFELPQSLTTGVVSAIARTARDIGMPGVNTLIQVDTAINPGNSGGPLLDIEGYVIGMNTAIYSGTGNNAGVGFAITSNLLRNVSEALINTGKYERSFIGVETINLTNLGDSLLKNLKVTKGTTGCLVKKVVPGSPAEKSGIKVYDVIQSVNGERINQDTDLISRVSSLKPGSQIKMDLLRDGKIITVTVTVERLSASLLADEDDEKEETPKEKQASYPASAKYGITPTSKKANRSGVVVKIQQGSTAYAAGLRSGDVILEINKEKVSSPSNLESKLKETSEVSDIGILVQVYRHETSATTEIHKEMLFVMRSVK